MGLRSTPSNVQVSATGLETTAYVTPATVLLKRKGNYVLTFSKEGYESKEVKLQKSLRGWMVFWDVFPWFPAGVVVDAITGAWYRLEPEQVSVTLEKMDVGLQGSKSIQVTLSTLPSGGLNFDSESSVTVSVRQN